MTIFAVLIVVPLPRPAFADEPLSADAPHSDALWTVTVTEEPSVERRLLTGRIVAETADGTVLMEDRAGALHQLRSAQIVERTAQPQPWSRMNSSELTTWLKTLVNDDYAIVTSEHYVICSNAAPGYSEFCSRLLEHIHSQFFEFFAASEELTLSAPAGPLPVLIFATRAQFEQYAAKQHPEISVSDTIGYYSVRDNQILLLDLTGDSTIESVSAVRRKLAGLPRQVSTVVHEAVHQLTFNSGLQVRMADNPLWISEGLAVWFEPTSAGSSLLWNRPGGVNPVHQPTFVDLTQNDVLPIRLEDFVASNKYFQDPDQLAAAYAESWALVTYLIRRDRGAFDRLLAAVSKRQPLIAVSAQKQTEEFERLIGSSADEIGNSMIPFIRKLRTR